MMTNHNHSLHSKRHRVMIAMVAASVLLVVLSVSSATASTSLLPSLLVEDTIQPSSASTTPKEVVHDCSNLFLYLPLEFELNGIASKLQNYVLALHVAAAFHRTLVVVVPTENERWLSGPLGCRPNENKVNQNVDFLELLEIPTSNACAQALCDKTYSEWKRILERSHKNSEIINVTCHEITTSVMISGGHALRRFYAENSRLTKQPDLSQWVSHLGSTPQQLEFFKNTSNTVEEMWIMGVAGLVAQKIQWRSSIRQQAAERITEMHLPPQFVAFHIRRGDKLISEAVPMVRQYWETRGSNPNNLNYLPLEAYVAKLNILSDPQDIYIATDDPVTVRKEAEQLEAMGTYWKFHFLSDHHHSHSGHMIRERNCTAQYDMTIDAIVDLEVLIQADVFVGEFSSNWGKFIHTMRINFTGTYPSVRDFRFAVPRPTGEFLGE